MPPTASGVDGMETVEYVPFGSETWRDPFPLYARLRAEDPVHYAPRDRVWVLSRFADVYGAVLDPKTYSSAHGISLANEQELFDLLPTMVMMDPPDHTRYRRLVNKGFSPKAVAELEPGIRGFVAERVEQLADGGGDLIARVGPAPALLRGGQLPRGARGGPGPLRGVDPGHRPGQLHRRRRGGGRAGGALRLLHRAGGPPPGRARRRPGVGTGPGWGPRASGLRTEEILGYAFVMIAGGNDTVTGLLGGAAELLTAHPDQRRLLADNPSLIGPAVDELLRMTSPVQGLCRVTMAPVTVRGVDIPAGSRVLLCYGSGNRDAEEFGPDAESARRHPPGQAAAVRSPAAPTTASGPTSPGSRDGWPSRSCWPGAPTSPSTRRPGSSPAGAFVRRYDSLPFAAAVA